ncbi:C-C chemokine receptor type 5-like [Littorina saxatilis]|uniref:C-C chemokine receptor type 5-like n=1 Tax=Littorina saxatilis TaxID=31220 RepID=UPI0038B54529
MEAWREVNVTGGSAHLVVPGGGEQSVYRLADWTDSQSNLSLHADNISATCNQCSLGGGSASSVNGTGGGVEDGGLQFLAYYEQLLSHPNIKMRDDLMRYLTPILVVFGNFSNLLAFVVLRRNKLRQHSVCFYMAAYAIANVLVLNLILGIMWLCFVLERVYISNITDWGCRLWTFVRNVITYSGIWFVVVLSVDRFVYLCYAHQAKTYCKLFAAKAITLVIVIMLIVVSIHAMWTYELQPQGCFISAGQDDLHIKTWPLWSATLYSYLPLTLLLFINIMLSASLCLRRHRQRRAQSIGGADDFALTTLVLSSAVFLLTVPATVINMVDIYFPSSMLSLSLIAEIELAKKIMEILSATNQTLLGVVLLVFSRSFRQELYAMVTAFRLKRRPKVYEMGTVGGASPGTSDRDTGTAGTSANNGLDTNGRSSSACVSSRNHIEYEVCNSSDMVTEVTTV